MGFTLEALGILLLRGHVNLKSVYISSYGYAAVIKFWVADYCFWR